MSSKRNTECSDGSSGKKRRMITMETKMDIIKRSDKGETPTNIGKALGYTRSTISTILKDKERITDHVRGSAPKFATIITKQRTGLLVEMERLLVLWLESQNQRNIPVSLAIIQAKALSIFSDLKASVEEETGTECTETFQASRGWFNRFKNRANFHNIKLQGEAASSDHDAASIFHAEFENIVEEGGYSLDQVFNVDETGLFWKKMPTRTYIAKEEKTAAGHKPGKDRITLLLGGNASGDCKLKPLLVYRALNPRIFAQKGILKGTLPVHWRKQVNAWCTRDVFRDWFTNCFIPEVERYCLRKEIPFHILLAIDNAPGHPTTLDDVHPNIKVVFLPKNTTPLIQPMDQGVIATFKAYYLRRTFSQAVKATEDGRLSLKDWWRSFNVYEGVKNIGASWDEVKKTTMRGVWNKLLPTYASDFVGFNDADIQAARNTVVTFGQQLDLGIEENDVIELLDSHQEELSNEDLIEMERQVQESGEDDEPNHQQKTFTTKELAKGFAALDYALGIFEAQDPNLERYMKAYRGVYNALNCYQVIYDERKKPKQQLTLDRFVKKRPTPPPPSTPSSPIASTSGTQKQSSSKYVSINSSDCEPDDPECV